MAQKRMLTQNLAVIIFPQDSNKVQIMVDKEAVDLINPKIKTVYWHAK